MSRYRVEVTTASVYFIEARDPESAATKGIEYAKAGVRPDYTLEPTADVDVVAMDSTGVAA